VAIDAPLVHRWNEKRVLGRDDTPTNRSLVDLDEALVQHSIGNFQEAANVGSVYEVAGRTVFFGCFVAGLVAADHYLV